MNIKKQLVALTIIRMVILGWLIHQGFVVFSDDGATRLLLAKEWAQDPFVAAQLPWLPLQFYVVGLLSSQIFCSTLAQARAGNSRQLTAFIET